MKATVSPHSLKKLIEEALKITFLVFSLLVSCFKIMFPSRLLFISDPNETSRVKLLKEITTSKILYGKKLLKLNFKKKLAELLVATRFK